jgi:amino acid transporter
MMFPLLIIGAKLVNKSRFIRASEMDFITDIAEIEAEVWPENKPTTLIGKFWDS